jgi:nitrite reductase/ring-hydroxylating ferredoxin subunit
MTRIDCVNPWSWYPVVASRDLAPGKLLPVSLNGEELVVWRSRDGAAAVWNSRCPHRGMRLALGAVAGNALTCAYHGWVFESSGGCSHIPAHPRITPSAGARTRVYPVREMYGYVWACLGEPARRIPSAVNHSPLRTSHVPVEPEMAIALAMARPLAWWTPADPSPANWRDDAMLELTGSAVTLKTATDAWSFTAVASLPGTVNCALTEGSWQSHYTVLMQPTGIATVALHLAIDEGDGAAVERRLAMNRAFIQMRRDAAILAATGVLARMQARIAQTRAADAIASYGDVS